MLCECGIYHGWKPNKDGFLQLMKNKKMPKHAPVDGVVWKGNKDKHFFCCFCVWFVLFACRWILALEYLQGLKGFQIGFTLNINVLISDGSHKWLKFVGCKSRRLASGRLKGQECWGPRKKRCWWPEDKYWFFFVLEAWFFFFGKEIGG